jgi:uncharacterized membrane protein YbaN (DUF454 family)
MLTIWNKLKKRLWIVGGTLCVGLGIVGIVIPLMPTTPFLLLGAVCYMRGSTRMYNALLRNRVFGNYLKNYLEGRAMSLKNKIWTLGLLWAVILPCAILATDNLVIRVVVGAIGTGVTVHIALIKAESRNVRTMFNEPVRKNNYPSNK